MCIIMYHQAGKTIPKSHLERSVLNHPDGFGIAYISKKKNVIFKTMDADELIDKYYKLLDMYPNSPFIVHCRHTTEGESNLDNCHPFRIDSEYVFAHNKTLYDCRPDKNDMTGRSDTRIFNEEVLRKLPAGWFKNEAIGKILAKYIDNSRIAIMNRQGEVWLLAEEKGEWSNDIWYSNDSYKYRIIRQRTYTAGFQQEKEDDNKNWDSPRQLELNFADLTQAQKDRVRRAQTYSKYDTWAQDGLLMRWNYTCEMIECYDPDEEMWRVYNAYKQEFVTGKKSCSGHKPDKWAERRTSVTETETKQTNKVESAKCSQCRHVYPKEQLKSYVYERAVMERICTECKTHLEEMGHVEQIH